MIGEGYALYEQTKQLDTADNSFFTGLKVGSIGFPLYFIPQKQMQSFESKLSVFRCADTTSVPGDRSKSTSETSEKRWPKQLRGMAKASFSKDESNAPIDPSSSQTKWSGLWGDKKEWELICRFPFRSQAKVKITRAVQRLRSHFCDYPSPKPKKKKNVTKLDFTP
ncbi:hypothetical protein V6N13_041928 [Hibiscus sabdariffa]|uniref:Uncharacterized protein n=1 Tax=Hibiscus sabdariffa TaxID=183260 RepID=A0ABR2DDI6_9ROSI